MVEIADWSWWRFAWGATGAAAPEIVRLYNIVSASKPSPAALQVTGGEEPLPKFSKPYFVISILFLAWGGAFAVAWGEDNPWKCLWVGVSLPLFVSTLAKRLPEDLRR